VKSYLLLSQHNPKEIATPVARGELVGVEREGVERLMKVTHQVQYPGKTYGSFFEW
jgi:hypothetical protein